MDQKLKLTLALAGGLFLAGCGSKDNSASPAANNAANTAQAAANAATNGNGSPAAAMNAATNAANAATNSAAATVGQTNDMNNDAVTKLKQVRDFIAAQKYDQADAALKDLEGKKSSLPQAVQDELPNLRKAVDGGKAAAGALGGQMPAMPSMGH